MREGLIRVSISTIGANVACVRRSVGSSAPMVTASSARAGAPWRMGATLDGRIEGSGAVFEAKFMLPWAFSEEAPAQKYMPQLQHNMWVVAARQAVLSVITGGGKWVEIVANADPLYQHLIVTAERKFWRCVESGEPPRLFGIEPPRPRIEAIRVVDMSSSNAWAEFAAVFARTKALVTACYCRDRPVAGFWTCPTMLALGMATLVGYSLFVGILARA